MYMYVVIKNTIAGKWYANLVMLVLIIVKSWDAAHSVKVWTLLVDALKMGEISCLCNSLVADAV